MLYEVLDADESRGGDGDLDFGEFAHRQLGGKGGGARGRRGKPVGGLDWGQGGRSWAVHGKVGAAAALCSGGGVPAVESERCRDGEDQWESEEVVVLSVWEGGDHRGELHGELLRGGGHGGGLRPWAQGGSEEGSSGSGRGKTKRRNTVWLRRWL